MTPEEHRALFFKSEARPHGLRLSVGAIFDEAAQPFIAELRDLDPESARAKYLGRWAKRLQDDKVRYA